MIPGKHLNKIFKEQQTSLHGLSESEIKKRQKNHGYNILEAKKRKNLFIVFLEEFKDLMVLILIVAAIFAFVADEIADGTVILFIVFLNALIGFIQKFKAEKAIEALKNLVAPKARVIRNGQQKIIDAKDLVPGDILILAEGDSVTADSIVFETNELEAQESALTGESVAVAKTITEDNKNLYKANMVFMGTIITHGTGKAVVIKTGMETEMGKIAKLTTETKKDLSPLQKELFHIGVFVGKLALVISIILLAVGLLIQGKSFVETLLFATSVAVAAVPEGLPATITIALAIGVQRLAKKNAIVKQLSSVETLGSTTVICSDKTGTLTKNEMTVKEIFWNGKNIKINGAGYSPEGTIELNEEDQKSTEFKMFMKIAVLCNNADLIQDKHGKWQILGDPTEGALLTLVQKSHFKNLQNDFEKIKEFAFDSDRKLMTVIIKDKKTHEYFVLTKGAPDSILKICHLNSKEKIIEQNNEMAINTLRTLGFAYKKITAELAKKITKEEAEKDLIFVGLTGIIDPPRPEVKQAVDMAHKAGIRTYIITGDHGLTALAIGKELGIVSNKRKNQIITGEKLEIIKDSELKHLLKDKNLDIIFARVSPAHKLRIVSLLKDLNEVVAVTGDGVNDAPALKKADIGIAMGITGTDVSKEVANMVLADDSYSTIVSAIKEGRTIYENLKKFVFYIFSSNISEIITVFTAIVAGLPAPLTAILILTINLGTDVLPAIALGVEPSEPDIMEKTPRNPKEKIINKKFVSRFTYLGIIMGTIVMVSYVWTLKRYGFNFGETLDQESLIYLKSSTISFALLVVIQMVNAFNARSEKHSIFKIGIFSNPYLLSAIFTSLLLTLAVIEIPFLQNYLHTTSLNLSDWGIIICASITILIIEEIRKFFTYAQKNQRRTFDKRPSNV